MDLVHIIGFKEMETTLNTKTLQIKTKKYFSVVTLKLMRSYNETDKGKISSTEKQSRYLIEVQKKREDKNNFNLII